MRNCAAVEAARAELEGKLDEARTMQDGAVKALSAAKVRLSEADTDRDARAKRRREIRRKRWTRWQGDVDEFTDQLPPHRDCSSTACEANSTQISSAYGRITN